MEITIDLPITIEEASLIDMHSVLNVANILNFELLQIGEMVGSPAEIDQLQDQLIEMAEQLRDPDEAYRQVTNVAAFVAACETALEKIAPSVDSAIRDSFVRSQENMRSIFGILQIRAAEIVARHGNPDAWVEHDIAMLKDNFVTVFRAIEQNSRGGYRIVYNLAAHEEGDYLVNFDITSTNGKTITIPAIFQDVMRDLLANARKYTRPGGIINAGLLNNGSELRFVVSDSGVGIPEGELETIVGFGTRGSNVQDRPTHGGGFGLTKAYYVTRRCGGRMWIDSPVIGTGGTRITIMIPVPR